MQSFTGKVVSTKMNKTVVVTFLYHWRHPKYKKIIRKTTKILAHNEIWGVKEGDTVKIVKSRPYSKNAHFQVVEIIK